MCDLSVVPPLSDRQQARLRARLAVAFAPLDPRPRCQLGRQSDPARDKLPTSLRTGQVRVDADFQHAWLKGDAHKVFEGVIADG